jgi:hypothetical protein
MMTSSFLVCSFLVPTLVPLQGPPEEPTAPALEPPSGLIARESAAFDGFTLFAPLRSGTIFLVDMAGEPVHRWEQGLPPISVDLLDDGRLVATSRIDDTPVFFGGGLGGRIRELDWNNEVLWEWVYTDENRALHHDIEVLPNGNYLTLVWEHLDAAEATALGRDPAAVGDSGWWPDAVLEVEPQRPIGAKIVWEWRMVDHLVQDRFSDKPTYGSPADSPGRIDANFDLRTQPPLTAAEQRKLREAEKKLRELGYAGGEALSDDEPPADALSRAKRSGDWTHVNSVAYHPQLDLIMLSSPRLNEILVIDHSTTTEEARGKTGGRYGKGGEVLYRWGNPRNHGAGTEADQQLFAQHQPEWIAPGLPGAGNVLVYNNGNGRKPVEFSSVDELELPFEPGKGFARLPGKPFGPQKPHWTYAAERREDFYSFFISGCQRLPNGNTFICSGQQGRLFEVTPEGRIVWEYWNPHGGELPPQPSRGGGGPSPVKPTSIFRATRLAANHPALAGKGLAPSAR